MTKFKLGIYGSAVDESSRALEKATLLSEAIAMHSDMITVVTGGCPGMPYRVASIASSKGVETIAFSPARSRDEHLQSYPGIDSSIYSSFVFVPKKFEHSDTPMTRIKYRNLTSTFFVDAAIIISGRWGTLNEFTNLMDFGKVVGVLTGTGGIADELPQLVPTVKKDMGAEVTFSDDPAALLKHIVEIVEKRRRYVH